MKRTSVGIICMKNVFEQGGVTTVKVKYFINGRTGKVRRRIGTVFHSKKVKDDFDLDFFLASDDTYCPG